MFDLRASVTGRLLFIGGAHAFDPTTYPYHAPVRQSWSRRDPSPAGRGNAIAKRGFDLTVAVLALILFAPVLLGIALLIRRDSHGPALFRQCRIGRHGRPFEMLKFRTMYDGVSDDGPLRQATRGDPRVTRFGAWLRCTSLDELPQLFNVLRGEMSIVGPRPHAPGTRAGGRLFEEVCHRYAARHEVRPGMTGLAQVRGWRGETDTEDKLLQRIDSDLEYIRTWTLWLDLRIVCRTIGTVLLMRNAY